MRKGIWQEFDGYQEIVEEIAVSQKLGQKFTPEIFSPQQYIDRLHPRRLCLRVNDIIAETPSTKTFRLVSEDQYLPPFQAGQYITLYLEIGHIRTSRPYSISSQPNQRGYYDITVKRVAAGLVSHFLLDRIHRGDTLTSSGPEGHFFFNPLIHQKNMVCIAGGSGITPVMSMIREICARGLDRTVTLFYGNRTTDDVIFHDELTYLSDRFKNIDYIPVIEEPADEYGGACGFMTGALIEEIIGDIDRKSFFVCGPKGLYDFCLPELEGLGIPRRKIRQELYGPPLDICEHPGWPQEIDADAVFTVKVKEGLQLKAKATETLLVSLEKSGLVLPTLCRSGDCSMCRLKILSGKVFQPAGVPVRKSDRQFGYAHACVSYPLEDLEVLI